MQILMQATKQLSIFSTETFLQPDQITFILQYSLYHLYFINAPEISSRITNSASFFCVTVTCWQWFTFKSATQIEEQLMISVVHIWVFKTSVPEGVRGFLMNPRLSKQGLLDLL